MLRKSSRQHQVRLARSAGADGAARARPAGVGPVPFYICPNCKNRSIDHDRLQEIDNVPVACERCGFGFLFELMDDYYPAPDAAFFVCDSEGRVIGCGRGSFELTGLYDERTSIFTRNALIGFVVLAYAIYWASRGQADPAVVNRMLKEKLG